MKLPEAHQVGFIAQEVEALLPDSIREAIVTVQEEPEIVDGSRVLRPPVSRHYLSEHKLLGPMVLAMQQMITKIETLEARIEALESV